MLKLPKGIDAHPKTAELEVRLSANLKPIWQSGKLELPHWKFDEAMQRSLQQIWLNKHLQQGLEAAEKDLAREQQGLDALTAKTGMAQNQRLSRFLILANDGSERFYRDAESLLQRNSSRLFGCVLDVSSEILGTVLVPQKKPAKAVMIDDRKALERFLLALI